MDAHPWQRPWSQFGRRDKSLKGFESTFHCNAFIEFGTGVRVNDWGEIAPPEFLLFLCSQTQQSPSQPF